MSKLEVPRTSSIGFLMQVAWPAFLAACLLQVLVFSMIDPTEIHWPWGLSQPSRQGIYTIAFFCFWLISMVCGSLTVWLSQSSHEVNNVAGD